ncbi:uncharacterized protein RAG0_11156 [Rhynchosporium agropyri]|uniref:Uncharacterized protein n=1 Tax=Rhynchosporium agropyri TaxID=914238 RepID=A0A1E1L2V5_9HELO|nr:uncharacterized protein RAG0_11156 [Rhynchosporium agropyri]
MFSKDCSMGDGLVRRTSSRKRSVHSMKSLMTLKLLSPTVPQSESWPSSACGGQRSTFGTISSEMQTSETRGKLNNPLGLSILPARYSQRDTPIYTEVGSPLPGRAYYTSDDLCFCSSPSACNEGCVFHEPDRQEDRINDDAARLATLDLLESRPTSLVNDAPRSSGLSFQCLGENVLPSQAARSSITLPKTRRSQLVRSECNVESWLSDAASEADQDVLACATIVSPRKAHMIHVSTSHSSTFSSSPHPRNFSLDTPSSTTLPVGRRYSWASSDDSPPDSPDGEWEFDDNRDRVPCKEPEWIFPLKRLDLAMNSPPMSPMPPKVFPDPPAASRFSFSAMSAGIEVDEDPNLFTRWSFDSTTLEEKTNIDIISDLEDIVSDFPRNMLLPNTPCIAEIRLIRQKTTQRSIFSPTTNSLDESHTRFLRDSKTVANFSRPRPITYLSSSKSTPMVQTRAWRSSYISSASTIHAHHNVPAPDLEPLARIFPGSSDYTRLGLYAHILAHMFTTSLSPKPFNAIPSPQDSDFPFRRRRDTPYWGSYKAAGHRSSHNIRSSDTIFQIRIQALKANLRTCIFRLMNNMDSNIRQADVVGGSELMLRAVEEVVRASEKARFSSP